MYGPECITTYIISKCDSVSDLLEVNILLRKQGYTAQDTRPSGRPPV